MRFASEMRSTWEFLLPQPGAHGQTPSCTMTLTFDLKVTEILGAKSETYAFRFRNAINLGISATPAWRTRSDTNLHHDLDLWPQGHGDIRR